MINQKKQNEYDSTDYTVYEEEKNVPMITTISTINVIRIRFYTKLNSNNIHEEKFHAD